MSQLILVAELIVAIALMVAILLQAKGVGMSAVFGGENTMYRSRRGVEKLLHRGTIALAAVFMILAIVNILISR